MNFITHMLYATLLFCHVILQPRMPWRRVC
jgi:hypothetical protein